MLYDLSSLKSSSFLIKIKAIRHYYTVKFINIWLCWIKINTENWERHNSPCKQDESLQGTYKSRSSLVIIEHQLCLQSQVTLVVLYMPIVTAKWYIDTEICPISTKLKSKR